MPHGRLPLILWNGKNRWAMRFGSFLSRLTIASVAILPSRHEYQTDVLHSFIFGGTYLL